LVLWIRTGNPDLDQEDKNDSQKGELFEIVWCEELSGLTGGLSFIGGGNTWRPRRNILQFLAKGVVFFSTIDFFKFFDHQKLGSETSTKSLES
jgi:hypothetical protein